LGQDSNLVSPEYEAGTMISCKWIYTKATGEEEKLLGVEVVKDEEWLGLQMTHPGICVSGWYVMMSMQNG
jgi:hypothetical protein